MKNYRWIADRYSNFGAEPSDLQLLMDEQLLNFKTNLVKLYRQKSKIIAEREALRFKYLTGYKTKFQNLVSAITSDMFADHNDNGYKLVAYIIEVIQSGIPMAPLAGGPREAKWGNIPMTLGGRLSINMLSPSNFILSEPFKAEGDPDRRPAYKIYPTVFNSPSYTPSAVIDKFFVGGSLLSMNLSALGTGLTGKTKFTIPPSEEWLHIYLFINKGNTVVLQLMPQYDYMKEKISKTYSAGNMSSLIDEMRSQLSLLTDQTRLMVDIQNTIDVAEGELGTFISSYKDYQGHSLVLAEVLAELKLESEKADVTPSPAPPQVPLADELPIVVVEEKKKSKMPLLAAAAVGIFMLTKGKE